MEKELNNRSSRPVAIWLLIGVGMIMVQILLGGITRLTGSGLSITEWNVVTGALPPMNETAWLREFEKYQQTPQYSLLNSSFSLQDFKFIFFWEWFHRLWARLIGVVFLIPFVIFIIQKRFRPSMLRPMIILFLLGALQGAVGWIMVASGLTGDAIYVQPVKLALHFLFALVLLCYTCWFAFSLLVPETDRKKDRRTATWTIASLIILAVQLLYGALMAGHKAAPAAPTWPDINGSVIPPRMLNSNLSLIENRITIHFIHRGLAYLLLLFIAVLTYRIYKNRDHSLLRKTGFWPLALVFIQIVLGIFAVLNSVHIVLNHWGVFEWLAQAHQLVAMFLLISLVWIYFLLRGKRNNE